MKKNIKNSKEINHIDDSIESAFKKVYVQEMMNALMEKISNDDELFKKTLRYLIHNGSETKKI